MREELVMGKGYTVTVKAEGFDELLEHVKELGNTMKGLQKRIEGLEEETEPVDHVLDSCIDCGHKYVGGDKATHIEGVGLSGYLGHTLTICDMCAPKKDCAYIHYAGSEGIE